MPRLYTSYLDSSFLHFSEYKKSVEMQKKFIQQLKLEKRKKILVRLGSSSLPHAKNNLLHYEKKIWKNRKESIKIETRDQPIDYSIKNSYVVIITQISSTLLLECLSSNVPFLIFSDLKKQISNSEFKKDLIYLKKNNIMFDNPEKISIFLNKKSPKEFLNWWNSEKNKKVIKKYREKYARFRPNIVNSLKEILKLQN